MDYTTEQERARRFWALVEQDPDCAACRAEMERCQKRLEAVSDRLPFHLGKYLWAVPTTVQLYFHRVIDVALREMRFPQE